MIYSCKLDNYDEPNASLFGSIIDEANGEPVEQDIINGVQIEYIEQGYKNPQTQYLIVKNNGTFRNNLMFAGQYKIRPVRGNFVPVDTQYINLKGEYKIDFVVKPYIRIREASIKRFENKVVATFKLEQTVPNKVKKIGLYAHIEPSVGEPMRHVAVEQTLNAVSNPESLYILEVDLSVHSSILKPGSMYFFRVGALIDAPEAKLNYVPAVRIST